MAFDTNRRDERLDTSLARGRLEEINSQVPCVSCYLCIHIASFLCTFLTLISRLIVNGHPDALAQVDIIRATTEQEIDGQNGLLSKRI
jgi:hypothetical protein